MFEFTFVQKLMLLGLGSVYLWYFMWVWKSSPTTNKRDRWGFSLKRKKDSSSDLDYNPDKNYFSQIQETKKRFGGKWFSNR